MPRKRRDEEVVISFWKQFARDKDCPMHFRIYCTYALAVHTGMIPAAIFPPGIGRYREQLTPQVVSSAEGVAVAETESVVDVKNFLKQLGGADANPQT
jgi:hypothetical protein